MKLLLTGANGFVGSHLVDHLVEAGAELSLLVRPTADLRFLEPHRSRVRMVTGSLDDPTALRAAIRGVTHVIHCAGATKGRRPRDLFAANRDGTARLVQVLNEGPGRIERFVHISSLAAGRPATAYEPALEEDPPQPQSVYGQSKRAAEEAVCLGLESEWVVLRPAAVYGPRDREFLPLFVAANRGWAPVFGGGRQELSLVYVRDLVEVVWAALIRPEAVRRVINVASPEVTTSRELVLALAAALGREARVVSLPQGVLRVVCGLAAGWARVSGRPTVLAHGKYQELAARGWVCDTTRLRALLGAVCGTPLTAGLETTAAWYRAAGWLREGRAATRQ